MRSPQPGPAGRRPPGSPPAPAIPSAMFARWFADRARGRLIGGGGERRAAGMASRSSISPPRVRPACAEAVAGTPTVGVRPAHAGSFAAQRRPIADMCLPICGDRFAMQCGILHDFPWHAAGGHEACGLPLLAACGDALWGQRRERRPTAPLGGRAPCPGPAVSCVGGMTRDPGRSLANAVPAADRRWARGGHAGSGLRPDRSRQAAWADRSPSFGPGRCCRRTERTSRRSPSPLNLPSEVEPFAGRRSRPAPAFARSCRMGARLAMPVPRRSGPGVNSGRSRFGRCVDGERSRRAAMVDGC